MKDLNLMYEWMHNISVTENLQKDFSVLSQKDCEQFIKDSIGDTQNIHKAIVDDNDTYMGTVSLKNINVDVAEFAIVLHPQVMGKGYAILAMKQIIEYGFKYMGLKIIYWYVSEKNQRAIKFYTKNNFFPLKNIPEDIKNSAEAELINNKDYLWYAVYSPILK